MKNGLVFVAMAVVALGFLALALTDSARIRAERPALRQAAVVLWWGILVVGWAVFAWLAMVAPGGLDAASAWVVDQSTAMRVALWLLLLPWTAALALWRTGLSEAVRAAGVLAIAALTFGLALQLSRPKSR